MAGSALLLSRVPVRFVLVITPLGPSLTYTTATGGSVWHEVPAVRPAIGDLSKTIQGVLWLEESAKTFWVGQKGSRTVNFYAGVRSINSCLPNQKALAAVCLAGAF